MQKIRDYQSASGYPHFISINQSLNIRIISKNVIEQHNTGFLKEFKLPF